MGYLGRMRKRHASLNRSCRFLSLIVIGTLLLAALSATPALALEKFRVAIMQSEEGAADHYRALEAYLKLKGIYIDFVPAVDYPSAAAMFANEEVDGMFSGSGVAGLMIMKDLAYPLVRPVDLKGRSTYWAVVVARKGAAPFKGCAKYLTRKRVACCSLASSGEFFLRSLPGFDSQNIELIRAGSHGQALSLLASGQADVAIVKNLVWDREAADLKGFEQIGSDDGRNPNDTLIIAKNADSALIARVEESLLRLGRDISPEAALARRELGIKGFVRTSPIDFTHSMSLLKKAGVTRRFNLRF